MNKTLLTDLYQITMNAAYFDNGKDDEATFDLFIRKSPEDWGFFIVNGVEDAIDYATNIKFTNDDIEYLRKQNLFREKYLDFLRNFKFEGEIWAIKEGTPISHNVPILRVTAKRTQAQFLECALLNMINFQTLIATKANRVVSAANGAVVIDYGLRRAQEEDAALKGARAVYIGGGVATSNVKAGKEYGIPIAGTHAHSFIMSFDLEIEAFRAYVKTFPIGATLLIDTYDTVEGAKNAAIVAKELEEKGCRLGAVRLDSGDLCELSKKVRMILDENNLHYVRIVASNDLNEYKITELRLKGAKIDGYGVGTEMITAKPVAAIPGVYKLVEDNHGAKIKLAPGKMTYPGKKQIFRVFDECGGHLYDVLGLEEEEIKGVKLLELVVKNGIRVSEKRTLQETQKYCFDKVLEMPGFLRVAKVSEVLKVKISDGLTKLVKETSEKYGARK